MIIALLGDARAAVAVARCAKSTQERLLVSPWDFYRAQFIFIVEKMFIRDYTDLSQCRGCHSGGGKMKAMPQRTYKK
jgi:hypothetical protein